MCNVYMHRFDIALMTGARVDGDERDDVLLNIATDTKANTIALSSVADNQIKEEKKQKGAPKVGLPFEFRIRVHEDRFEVKFCYASLMTFFVAGIRQSRLCWRLSSHSAAHRT